VPDKATSGSALLRGFRLLLLPIPQPMGGSAFMMRYPQNEYRCSCGALPESPKESPYTAYWQMALPAWPGFAAWLCIRTPSAKWHVENSLQSAYHSELPIWLLNGMALAGNPQ